MKFDNSLVLHVHTGRMNNLGCFVWMFFTVVKTQFSSVLDTLSMHILSIINLQSPFIGSTEKLENEWKLIFFLWR